MRTENKPDKRLNPVHDKRMKAIVNRPDLPGFVDSDDLPCVVNDCKPFRNIQENNSADLDYCGCR